MASFCKVILSGYARTLENRVSWEKRFMINMKIGTSLRCVALGVRGEVWTFKDLQGNRGNFGVKGTSLSKNSELPKISRFEEKYTRVAPHGCKQLENNSRFESTGLASNENVTVAKLKRPSPKNNFEITEHIQHSYLGRRDRKTKESKLCGISQSARQKAYLRMVFSRPRHGPSKRNGNMFDEDYISLDDELFSRYLKEGSEIQQSSFVPTKNVRSAGIGIPSGIKSGKCRLRRRYADPRVTASNTYNNLVKYGS